MLSSTSPAVRRRGGRLARWGVAFTLTVTGLAAFAGQPASASPPAAAVLVVSDSVASNGTNFSATQLLSVNSDGTGTTKSPVALPTSTSGSNKPFALSGSQTANGSLSLTSDGNYLTLAGYAAAPDLSSPATVPVPKDTTAAAVERVVARVDKNGVVDTSTGLGSTGFSKSHPRSVVSADGQTFYVTGDGGSDAAKAGIIKVDLGGGSQTPIGTTQKNVRLGAIAGGDLYATSDKTTPVGVSKYGSGLPTTATPPTAAITTPSTPTGLTLLDASASVPGVDTAYVVIDNAAVNKYTYDGTAWSAAGSITGPYAAVAASVNGSQVDLYAVSGNAGGNSLVSFQDSNPSGALNASDPVTILTAAAGHEFHGVAFAPNGWILDKPTNVQASQEIEKTTISWNAVAGATSYTVTLKDGADDAPGSPQTVSGTSADFSGLAGGTAYTASVVAKNDTGSSAGSDPVQVTPDTPPLPTTTTDVAIDQIVPFGVPVPVKFTVTSPDPNQVPDGAVSLKVGSHSYPGTLGADGTTTVNIPAGDVPAGTFRVKAAYAGSAGFQQSSATSTLNVAKASTQISPLVFNPTSLSSSKTSTVKISVVPTGSAVSVNPTGKVAFYDGTTLVTTGTLGSDGTVTLSLPKFKKATHTFKATFTGTGSFSSSSLTVTGVKVS